MSTSTGLWSAAIAAVVALLVFVGTQLWVGRREKSKQAYDRRRTALREAQDAALELRNRLGEFGPLARRASGHPGAELAVAQQHADEALAALDVCLTRVDDRDVLAAVAAWRDRARFHYVSAEEVTTTEELDLWRAMNETIGAALRSESARA
jgi:hypothetical protein